ncbi:hypothetical protein [Vibrio coralliilyticus]|nr:hypothetical protein [Vibrio coralliilyticus]
MAALFRVPPMPEDEVNDVVESNYREATCLTIYVCQSKPGAGLLESLSS